MPLKLITIEIRPVGEFERVQHHLTAYLEKGWEIESITAIPGGSIALGGLPDNHAKRTGYLDPRWTNSSMAVVLYHEDEEVQIDDAYYAQE